MDKSKQIALFRYQVIAPLLPPDPEGRKLKRRIQAVCATLHQHPYKGEVKVYYSTVEEWYYCYKANGLTALEPDTRRDRGTSRCIDDNVARLVEELLEAHPQLTGPALLKELVARDLPTPSPASLYRFLRARGLSTGQNAAPTDHRAYEFEFAGDCWQCDVMFGPHLPDPKGHRRRTYLIAIIDDATRFILHAQFYFEQDLRALKDCLKQALLKRGMPKRLYVDNGRIFRSRALLQAAAFLGFYLIHSGPYRPEGRAKGERFFGSIRTGFLVRMDLSRIENLDQLNRFLFAWIEGEYHHAPHRGIENASPWDRWVALSEHIRAVPPDVDLDWIFLEHARRRVAKDGTVSVRGKRFEAGPDFIGRKFDIRFDTYDLRKIWLIDADEKRHMLLPVDLHANARGARRKSTPHKPSNKPRPPLLALEQTARDLENQQPT